MIVIGFSGLPGSGKSSAIEAVKDLGPIITMGDIIRKEAQKRNLPPTAQNLGMIAKDLRKKYGASIIAEKCVDLIKSSEENVIFVDGIRSLKEVKIFRNSWTFPIIAIIMDEKLRYKRLKERARSDDPLSFTELLKRDNRELDFGLKEVIDNADYKINNNSTIAELQEKTRKIILNIMNK